MCSAMAKHSHNIGANKIGQLVFDSDSEEQIAQNDSDLESTYIYIFDDTVPVTWAWLIRRSEGRA